VLAHCACWAKGTPMQEGKRAETTRERWQQVRDLREKGAAGSGSRQAARWRTSQTVPAISSSESASSQPPSISWNGQNRTAGW
jgi:hypothetical protein